MILLGELFKEARQFIEDGKSPLIIFNASLNSKLFANYKKFFSAMIVEAFEKLETFKNKDLIGIKHVISGAIIDSFLVDDIAFKRFFLCKI
jgi:T-complex protein 1 subunit eta